VQKAHLHLDCWKTTDTESITKSCNPRGFWWYSHSTHIYEFSWTALN